jgi:hypothetical protein
MKRASLSFFPTRAVFCAALLLAPGGALLSAQQPPQLPPPGQALAPNQLDDLVAPIALYPDPLVSQILVASTYPLELVQASQWLQRNPGLHGRCPDPGGTAAKLGPEHTGLGGFSGPRQTVEPGHHVDDKSWKRVSESASRRDGRRTANAAQGAAGGKIVLDEPADCDHHERLRAARHRDRARRSAGDVPADYDPAFIWGPPLYYPYASWYYPGAYFGFGVGIPMGLYFGGGWGGWGGWGWGFGWGGHNIFVNNSFIHRYNFNSRGSASLSGRSAWAHDASHRGGVPYSNAALANRYRGNVRQNLQTRGSAGQAQARRRSIRRRANGQSADFVERRPEP